MGLALSGVGLYKKIILSAGLVTSRLKYVACIGELEESVGRGY